MSTTRRIAVNALSNYLSFAVSFLVMMLLTPIIIRGIGEADYGLWTLTFSVLGFFALVDFGFATSVVKFVAECRGQDDSERRNRILSTLLIVYIALALLAILGVTILGIAYNHIFSIPETQHGKALVLLGILAARSLVIALPLGLFRGLLYGEQKIWQINAVQSGSSVLAALLSWWAMSTGMGVIILAWINLLGILLEHVIYIGLCYRSVPSLRISIRMAEWSMFRELTSFSSAQFIVNVANLVLLRTDPILVKFFLPLPSVAVYGIALKIAESAHLLTKQFINVLSPVIAEMKGRGDEQGIRFILVHCAKYAFAPAVMLAIGAYCFATDAIILWVGEEFRDAGPVLIVLMTAMGLAIPQIAASTVLAMTGHHAFAARAAVIGTVTNITVSVILAPWFGLLGIAGGTLITAICIDIGVVVSHSCKIHDVGYLEYARCVFMPMILPAAIQFLVSIGIKFWLPPNGLIVLVGEAIPGAIVFLLLFWITGLGKQEKALLKARFSKS